MLNKVISFRDSSCYARPVIDEVSLAGPSGTRAFDIP